MFDPNVTECRKSHCHIPAKVKGGPALAAAGGVLQEESRERDTNAATGDEHTHEEVGIGKVSQHEDPWGRLSQGGYFMHVSMSLAQLLSAKSADAKFRAQGSGH